MIDKILQYFPSLNERQRRQYEQMMALYPEWNEKINVISRRDIANLEVHHILHSLAVAKFIRFAPGTHVLDFGCGGGFPSLPLAVLFPDVHFHLLDRIAKKLRVAHEITAAIGLDNTTFQHGDIAECKEKVEFVVSRAVMPLPDLVKLCRKNISPNQFNGYPNGLITLKGGNLEAEIRPYKRNTIIEAVDYLLPGEQHFADKFLTYTTIVPIANKG